MAFMLKLNVSAGRYFIRVTVAEDTETTASTICEILTSMHMRPTDLLVYLIGKSKWYGPVAIRYRLNCISATLSSSWFT